MMIVTKLARALWSARRGAALSTIAAIALAVVVPPPAGARQDAPPPSAPPSEPPPDAEPEAPKRLMVQVSRNERIYGTVELDDGDVLVLRLHPGGEVRSLLKSRVLEIVPLVEPAPGQRGTVYLREGQRVEGIVIEDGFERVVLVVEDIRMTFGRDQVARVDLVPTFEERYADYKAALGDRIGPRHLELARWLVSERRYPLARAELEAIISAKPDLSEARRMLQLVDAQLALEQPGEASGALPAPGDATSDPGPDRGPVDVRDMLPTELIDREDVNIIRVYEIDFDDPPEIAIDQTAIRALLEQYGSSNLIPREASRRTALFRAEPVEVVRLMFALRARELYPRIQVLSDPRSLALFRQRVHNTWLINTCATSRCHGGPFAGRFFLHRRNYHDERVRYTNLLILERLDLGLEFPLVNYDVPMDSLIVQFGLPREVARLPHPDVRGWKAIFTRSNQRALRHSIEWIESMMVPRPQYPVDYEPPMLGGGEPPQRRGR